MIYIFLAVGFEEVEALTPLDILIRAGADIKTVGIGKKLITGAHGIQIYADLESSEITDFNVQMIILPGGMPGTLNLEKSEIVTTAIKNAHKNNAFIAAICAAPSILGKMGLLSGKQAVCFPGYEEYIEGATVQKCGVITDGTIITAAGMGVALEFGLGLVKCLYGERKANELFESTQAYRY